MTILTFTTFLKMLPSSFLPFVSSLQANWRKKGTLYWLRLKKKKKKLFHVFPSKVFGALFPPFLASILWQGLVRIIIQPHLSLSLSLTIYSSYSLSLSLLLSLLSAPTHIKIFNYCHLLRRHFCLYQKKAIWREKHKKNLKTHFCAKMDSSWPIKIREREKQKNSINNFYDDGGKKMCFFFSIRVRP